MPWSLKDWGECLCCATWGHISLGAQHSISYAGGFAHTNLCPLCHLLHFSSLVQPRRRGMLSHTNHSHSFKHGDFLQKKNPKNLSLECQSAWAFVVLSRRGFKVYVKEVHKEISKFTDKGLGKYSPLFLISDYRGYARAEESMMQMIWCKGALSIITGHFHRHELIYQEERLAQSLFKLYLYQQPIHCHCQRLCWLRTRRELELLPWVSVIVNQRLRGMMRDRSWEPWWHPHTSAYIKM